MTEPNFPLGAQSPGDSFEPREPGGALRGNPLASVKATLVAGFDPAPTGGVRVLLQSRLQLLSLILALFFAVSLPFQTLLFGFDPDFLWSALLPQCVILATLAANAATLRSNRPRPLGWLRADELVCFGVLTVAFAWVQYNLLRGLPVYGRRGPLDLFIFAAAWDFTWFVLIVIYGLFIPNTRRRCAVVVGVLAGIPLAMATVVGLPDPAVEGLVLGQFLFAVGIHVTLGAALAVFAAGRSNDN
ncbi:hypothetical protein BH10PLA2_BH10PLA2_31050 [soil metagenome]